MSRPKYLTTKRNSTLSILVAAEELTAYLFKITSNEKHFPRAYRPTLVEDIRKTCMRMMKMLYRACYRRPTTVEDFERLHRYRNEIQDSIIDLKCLLTETLKLLKLKNPRFLASLFDEVTVSYNKWSKNMKRLERKAQKRMHTDQEEELETITDHWLHRQVEDMPHDEEGFVVLVPCDGSEKTKVKKAAKAKPKKKKSAGTK